MKIKSKADLRQAGAETQFRKAHLKMLHLPPHMGILPLREVLEDDKHYYVVMERAKGGSLLGSLLEEFPDGIMPEKVVKRVMKEILSAIAHLHLEGVLHRDIKMDNLVVEVDDEPSSPGLKVRTVKIIDFDIADPDWEPGSPGKQEIDWAGTLRSSAPETFLGRFSQKSDLYSVGTVLYFLMSGRPPYDDSLFYDHDDAFDDLTELTRKLSKVPIDWSATCWRSSPLCKDFCQSLLAYNPALRPATAEEAAQHEWFKPRCLLNGH